ncbi:AsmA-like protein [Ancylobacter aquaticus]|uniref:AsmA-like protein n=1 Tax=Ancylobacter aquaticus TaxID=100 RepID=A0A4R1I080_ANCAQ|nr:AsmA family protein [Ancylobacter aquaticus]TCK23292.1 AsmA-like protein [Ancylobacter aquaticus]
MQNLLLTIAGAIILAVAAAFAAPFVVDWSQWRSTFEAQAARTLGAPVVIRGPIDAQILPTPRVVLRDVSIGVDGGGTGLSVAELSGRLNLGALMRGEVVADHVGLLRPRGRLVVDTTGKLSLPTGVTRPGGFSIADISVTDGSFEVVDRANERALKLDNIDLTGAVGGPTGPVRLEGEADAAGLRRRVRLSLTQFAADGTAKMRLGAQNVGSPLAVDADGVLSLAGGAPSFRGRAALVRAAPPSATAATPGSAGADLLKAWSLSAKVEATSQAVAATELSLTLDAAERPVELSGAARLVGAGPGTPDSRLDLTLAARQLDLGAMTGGATPLAATDALARLLAPLADLAIVGSLDLSSDTVLLAGSAAREVKAGLDWSPGGWRARTLEARLPGGAHIALSGSLPRVAGSGDPNAALFGGSGVLEAQDLPGFVAWAMPQASGLVASLPAGAARLSAELSVSAGGFALDKVDLSAGDSRFAGTAAYTLPAAGGRGRVDAVLTTSDVDVDALLPPVQRLVNLGLGTTDLNLSLSGQQVRLAGGRARSLDVILKGGADGLGIERLAIEDLAGLDLTGSGRLAAFGRDGAGDARFTAKLSGPRADGLPGLAVAFGLTRIEPFLTATQASLAPVDLTLALVSQAGRTTVDADGRLGGLSGTGQIGFGADGKLSGRAEIDARDGSAVLSGVGVPGLRPKLGPARLTLDLDQRIEATLDFAGSRLRGEGTAALDAAGRLDPDLALTLESADLAVLLPQLAAAGTGPVPARFTGALAREGEGWRIGALSGSLGDQPLAGTLGYTPGEPVRAELATPRWNVARALGLVVGAAGAGEAEGWSRARFGPAPLSSLAAELKLNVARFDLPGGLALGEATIVARLAQGRLAVESATGTLAGGPFSGKFNLARTGEAVQFDGRLGLTSADSAVLFAALGVTQPKVRGRVSTTLDVTGRGNSPFALASQLQGQGSFAIEGLEVDQSDPKALHYVMLATERGPPPDQQRLAQLLSDGLARAPLKLARVESAVSVVDGVARTSAARLAVGEQRFGLSGALDIPALSFEATLEMQDVANAGLPAAPAAAVRWGGPLAAPDRRFDLTALSTAINMRALDRETKRLEAEYGRTPLTDGGEATDAAPARRLAPSPAPAPQAAPRAASPANAAPRAASPAATAPRLRMPATPAAPRAPTSPARPAGPQSYYGQYSPPGAMAPGSAAPPLAPPVDIPNDPLRSTIILPPLAP